MIRQFVEADMDAVLDIWLKASIKAHDFVKPGFWESKVSDMRYIYLPESETYVYEDTGIVKGFFSLHQDVLAAIFVSPEHQGESIGRMLIDAAKALRENLLLEVFKENERTIRFYERNGFRAVAEKLDEHTGHVELVMEFRP